MEKAVRTLSGAALKYQLPVFQISKGGEQHAEYQISKEES